MAKSLLTFIISLSLTGVVGLIELYLLEHFEAKYTSRQTALFYASLAIVTMAGYIVTSNIIGA